MPHACIVTKDTGTATPATGTNPHELTHIVENVTDTRTLCNRPAADPEQEECDCHPVRHNRGTCGECERICHQKHPH